MTALALKILLKTKLNRFARRWACWLSSNPTFLTSVLVFLIVLVSILVFPLSSITSRLIVAIYVFDLSASPDVALYVSSFCGSIVLACVLPRIVS